MFFVKLTSRRYSSNMASNLSGSSTTLFLEVSQQENVSQKKSVVEKTVTQKLPIQKTQSSKPKYHWKIAWEYVIMFTYIHLGALYGLYILLTVAKFYTLLWSVAFAYISLLGVTAGSHRLWAHQSYKAKWPMRFILMILQTTSFQKHIYKWVKDHRIHHKYMDTDADPHNSKRGFFFSHIGWLLVDDHPDVINKSVTIDMSDLEKDSIIIWQRNFYYVLMPFFCFVLPTWIPYYFWNEEPMYAWYANLFRYAYELNITWLVNSAAHMWGTKPYDNSISPTDSYSVVAGVGEGWHNYHHVFPWDYKAAELGDYSTNFTAGFIDFFAWIGWAYDLKTVNHDMIKKRAARTGDGSRYERIKDHDEHYKHENIVWGWDDSDMTLENKQNAKILNKSD